ncbi:hypothetical protein [Corynebacterium pacaense]|uniref:hypothetical protein n=1 Tax=Corynebacterium pacaense TaxID=1816684 RepID=UPI0009BC6416|nr:hypothetical protein [Corynebacterium pacaense]
MSVSRIIADLRTILANDDRYSVEDIAVEDLAVDIARELRLSNVPPAERTLSRYIAEFGLTGLTELIGEHEHLDWAWQVGYTENDQVEIFSPAGGHVVLARAHALRMAVSIIENTANTINQEA